MECNWPNSSSAYKRRFKVSPAPALLRNTPHTLHSVVARYFNYVLSLTKIECCLLVFVNFRLNDSNNESRSADKLVTRSSFMDPGRDKVLSDICREAVVGGVVGQVSCTHIIRSPGGVKCLHNLLIYLYLFCFLP